MKDHNNFSGRLENDQSRGRGRGRGSFAERKNKAWSTLKFDTPYDFQNNPKPFENPKPLISSTNRGRGRGNRTHFDNSSNEKPSYSGGRGRGGFARFANIDEDEPAFKIDDDSLVD